MSQGTASKPTGQKAASLSTPVTVAGDQAPTKAEARIIELLEFLVTELRILNFQTRNGLNLENEPDALRNDPFFTP